MPSPHVILDSSMSLNGRLIAYGVQRNKLNEYRKQELRGRVDAIMVSSQDIIETNPEYRVKASIRREPVLVVIDKHCEMPLDAAVLKDERKKIILVVSKGASPTKVRDLQKMRPDIEVLSIGEHAVNLAATLAELQGRGLNRVLVEGGPAFNTRVFRERLVNEVYLMVYPLLSDSKELVFEEKLEGDKNLALEGILQYGDHIVLHYMVK